MNSILILDYGLGNLFGLKQACLAAGLNPIISNDKKKILEAKGLILPGVGAFGAAMKNLNKLDILNVINNFAKSGKTLLGLCLGMQLLMDKSFEFSENNGLGLINGEVDYLGKFSQNKQKIKIPHIGWNSAEINQQFKTDKIFRNIPNNFDVYFVHSFCLKSTKKKYILTETAYENIRFCSGVKKDNIMGFQFHPENSGKTGIKLLSNIFKN